MATENQQVRLAARPEGAPEPSNFTSTTEAIPEPADGEVLVRAIYLSLDPYMRGRISDTKSYVSPTGIGDVMPGAVVGEVAISNADGLSAGDFVEGYLGWQTHAVAKAKNLRKIDPTLAPISSAIGVLGMPGLTAYFGLLKVGGAKAGDTVVVTAASGAVGAVVGQIARIKECRVVGIAGSDDKVNYVTDELRFDAGINYRTTDDLDAALKAACPNGIDVHFDNVGGEIADTIIPRLNPFARVAICGNISQYNATVSDQGARIYRHVLVNRLRIQGFIVFDFLDHYAEAYSALGEWVSSGTIKYKEDIVEGLDNAPDAFIGLLEGKNFGKLLVQVGEDPTR
ncbi:MAG: NADP-dependent oxidoreductase [Rhodospirillaceae bacterium]|nr:NADP-dependent oxidoreductase [Rhodospirillaceae bacterium]